MHTLEPYFNWRNLYIASEDERSPFYGREYSEFEYTDHIYNHLIHPQWDNIGSTTLFAKILFTEYDDGYCIIEFIGEWNDCLYNDVMTLKRDVIDPLISEGIDKFILITENVLNFHGSDDCYYEEWIDELEDGWVCLLNAREHIIEEMCQVGIDQYFVLGGTLENVSWRTNRPLQLFQQIEAKVNKRLAVSFA
ncbi:MAG: hypothetical protein JKY53_10805 [Flavobacteriales bacterium]|nr:hypothetical protein [Flavobacteriales bacterium]